MLVVLLVVLGMWLAALRSDDVEWVRCVGCGEYCTGRTVWCPRAD